MKAKNVTKQQLLRALAQTNKEYKGNLKFHHLGPAGKGFNFRLTVCSAKQTGGRRDGGRPIAAACWHAHRDFFFALFELAPDAIVASAKATYRGREDFVATFSSTGNENIGSVVAPLQYRAACKCETVVRALAPGEGTCE